MNGLTLFEKVGYLDTAFEIEMHERLTDEQCDEIWGEYRRVFHQLYELVESVGEKIIANEEPA